MAAWCFVTPAWVSVAATCSDGSVHSGGTSAYKISDKIENSSGSFNVP